MDIGGALFCGWIEARKERRTKAAPSTPAKGPTEQHLADAPLRGRGTRHCLCRSGVVKPQLAVLREAVLDARASFRLSM
jgi:hypothetical protein